MEINGGLHPLPLPQQIRITEFTVDMVPSKLITTEFTVDWVIVNSCGFRGVWDRQGPGRLWRLISFVISTFQTQQLVLTKNKTILLWQWGWDRQTGCVGCEFDALRVGLSLCSARRAAGQAMYVVRGVRVGDAVLEVPAAGTPVG